MFRQLGEMILDLQRSIWNSRHFYRIKDLGAYVRTYEEAKTDVFWVPVLHAYDKDDSPSVSIISQEGSMSTK